MQTDTPTYRQETYNNCGIIWHKITDALGVLVRYCPMEEQNLMQVLCHDREDGRMHFRPIRKGERPTTMDEQSFKAIMDECIAQSMKTGFFGMHKDHPYDLAERAFKASLTPFSKKRMPEPDSVTTPLDMMLQDGFAQLMRKDEPQPLTGFDEKRGEAI